MNTSKLCTHLGMEYVTKGVYIEEIYSPAPIDNAEEGMYSFCDHPGVSKPTRRPLDILDDPPIEMSVEEQKQAVERISNSRASVIIVPSGISHIDPIHGKELIFVDNPRMAFMNVVEATVHVYSPNVDYRAIIFHERVKIGKNVSIGPGTVVGASGFGFWRLSYGELRKFPQIGGVIIEDHVEIQANSCIDCGALGDTIIRRGAKIDNFVHIAHNVEVGENVAIVAHAMIGGGVKIGKNSWIGPSASILNAVKIGEGCVVGMGSVVIKDVPDGAIVKGVPAK